MTNQLSPETLRIDMGEELMLVECVEVTSDTDKVPEFVPIDKTNPIYDQYGDIHYYPGIS